MEERKIEKLQESSKETQEYVTSERQVYSILGERKEYLGNSNGIVLGQTKQCKAEIHTKDCCEQENKANGANLQRGRMGGGMSYQDKRNLLKSFLG